MKFFTPVHLIFLLGFTHHISAGEKVTFALSKDQISNLQLGYEKVEKRTLRHTVSGIGVVHFDEKRVFDIAPRISGFVTEDFTTLGDKVKAGDELFRLQSADLSEMVSAYVKAEQEMNFVTSAAVQEERLADKGLSSKEQVRLKQLESQQAIAAHARALQPLKLLHFDEATVHQYLSNVEGSDYTSYTVTSLGDGEIIEKSLRLGAVVDPNASLITIADLSEVWVDFSVSIRDASRISVAEEVEVESSISHETSLATIIYVAPIADEENRMVKIRASLPNHNRLWRPGTPVQVETTLAGREVEPALTVPASALIDYAGGTAVFLTDGSNSFVLTPVETGSSDGSVTEIISGIQDGELVVSKNAAQLKGHLEMTASE